MAELGERVGLSHTPCWRRVKNLEAAGFIRDRVVLLDPDRLGLSVNVFVEVHLKAHDEDSLNAFEAAVQAIDEVVECYTVSGERLPAARSRPRRRGIREAAEGAPGAHTGCRILSSTFALRQVKYTTRLPL